VNGAEAAARKAIALDPDYVGGYAALAGADSWQGKWIEAIDLAKKGLSVDQNDPELLNNYSETLRALGYLKEALSIRERLALLEPLSVLYRRQTADLMLANGMFDAGIKELENLKGAAVAMLYLAPAYARQGRFEEAADTLLQFPFGPQAREFQKLINVAVPVLRAAANKSKPPGQLPAFDEMGFVYLYAGVPQRILDWPEKAMKNGDYRPMVALWWPVPPNVRMTERFKTLVRQAGLVDYWKTRGWPPQCHPTTGDDFACN
jgi:tetratricopeptide (TPR) repeat protein